MDSSILAFHNYNSTVQTRNGISNSTLYLKNTNYYDRQIFPSYPNALVNCPPTAAFCQPPAGLEQFSKSDISAFAHNFRTPKVNQASLGLEREIAEGTSVEVSYTFVQGQNLIRARDVNLPPPVDVSYPVYDSSGVNLLGYDNVQSFSTWQMIASISCPFPPCINPISRPIPQLGAITVFESAASSVYHGLTVSIHRQMSRGFYFRMAYTYAHELDDGQDALVAGQPATVQDTYAPKAERGTSVTDQRQRFVFSWITEPKLFEQPFRAQPTFRLLEVRWRGDRWQRPSCKCDGFRGREPGWQQRKRSSARSETEFFSRSRLCEHGLAHHSRPHRPRAL